jgi:tRNA nucleotidyltransferase (CCA-adding enzyme)
MLRHLLIGYISSGGQWTCRKLVETKEQESQSSDLHSTTRLLRLLFLSPLNRSPLHLGTLNIASSKRIKTADMAAAMRREFNSSSTIAPTVEEQRLFDLCLATANRENKGTIVRVAGGWVRDKLLGMNNDDIDIALDNMTGVEFGECMRSYMKDTQQGNLKTAVIKANPDQSKHLETVTAHVAGFEIDMTNLRSETYSDGSRIPEIKIGTPLDDAMRRDLTINSLFYNLNSQCVEDFTGRGLEDLSNGICRTPLDPQVTFVDDPLRILRTVRFATRFRFSIDPAIIASGKNEEIRMSLSRKVSRERIGKEVEGMLSGRNAHLSKCLRFFQQMDLLPLIFTTNIAPNDSNEPEIASNLWESSIQTLEWLEWLLRQPVPLMSQVASNGDLSRMAVLAGAVLPFNYDIKCKATKNKPMHAASAVLFWSLKLKMKDCTESALILRHVDQMSSLADISLTDTSAEFRVDLGMLLRDLKELWMPCLALAAAKRVQSCRGSLTSDHTEVAAVSTECAPFQNLFDVVEQLGLSNVWQLQPLVRGDELKSLLGIVGPAVGDVMKTQTLWQLKHPEGTKEEFLATLN